MASKALPCPTVLRQLLRCDPETGKLFWLRRSSIWFSDGQKTAAHSCSVWNARYADKEAFTSIMTNGYHSGTILDKKALAHRVIWALTTGKWPEFQIDHINGVRSDNRLENLREVTNAQNARNMTMSISNRSGATGVFWLDEASKWVASIGMRDGRRKHLGRFLKIEDAITARKDAELRYGYHANHGMAEGQKAAL